MIQKVVHGKEITVHVEVPEGVRVQSMSHTFVLHSAPTEESQYQLFKTETSEVTESDSHGNRRLFPVELRPLREQTHVAKSPPESVTNTAPPAAVSLLAQYNELLLPLKQKKASKKTWKDHQTSCAEFDEWLLSEKHLRCVEPVVFLIETQADLFEQFARHRFTEYENSAITVNRRLTHVKMTITAMQKAGRISRLAIDKLSISDLKQLRRDCVEVDDSDQRRIPAREEIDALATHVDVARYPYGEHAPYFWRGWIRYCALFGPRGRDLVSPVTWKPGLRRQDIVWDTLCPVADVTNALGRELHSPHGWLWYYVGKDHTSDSPRVLFPMPGWLRQWIRFFAERSPDSERVFPGIKPGKWMTQRALSAEWGKIIAAAGVDPSIVLSEGKGGRIAIRKAAANWWHLTTMQQTRDAALADKVADYVLHHKSVTVSQKHYLSVQAAVMPTMLQLLESFPLPAADAPAVSMLPE